MLDKNIALILVVLFLDNTSYGMAVPFLPILISKRGISSIWTGLVFSSFSIAYTIVSPFVGAILDKVGHR